MRTASVVILLFAALLIAFGVNMFQLGQKDSHTARELLASGMIGTVVDARAQEGRTRNGQLQALRVELRFVGANGEEHVLETTHFPGYHPPLDSPRGYVSDFPTKDLIVGQQVLFRLGSNPAVELKSGLPALSTQGWGFVHYLGLAMTGMGVLCAVGGTISFIRAIRKLRAANPQR